MVRTSSGLFTVHKLNAAGLKNAQLIADQFEHLHSTLESIVGEQTIGVNMAFSKAEMHLEAACFYTKKALASNIANQERSVFQAPVDRIDTASPLGWNVGGITAEIGRAHV